MRRLLFVLAFVAASSTIVAQQPLRPLISARGIVNAASYITGGLPGGSIARGSLFSIFGVNLGPTSSPGFIVVVDRSSYQTITGIPVGNLPHAVAVTPSGHHLFVTNALSNSISWISTDTNTVIQTITFPNGAKHPLGLTFIR